MSAVLQLASTYQSKASDKQLPYKNLGKVHRVVEERKVKNNEAKLLDDRIRVGVTLWSADNVAKALKEVSLFIFSNISQLTF